MERQTFILLNTRTYRHSMTVYVKGVTGKLEKRNVKFTTEHKVRETERYTNARLINAEFSTSDELLIDGLFRDTGYGKTFTHKSDPDGKMKRERFNVTPIDSKKLALESLFKNEGLPFDGNKSVEVLNEEYQFHIQAKTGAKIGQSTATAIPVNPNALQESIAEQATAARKKFADKYGMPIPVEFENDLIMLENMSNPEFDGMGYLEEKGYVWPEDGGDDLPSDAESLGKIYFDLFQKNVANPKKNDAAWIKQQILEARGQ